MISGFHLSDSDKTEIRYSSINRNDLEKEYEILKTFLSEFKAYSKTAITKEETQIKSKYSLLWLDQQKPLLTTSSIGEKHISA